MSVGPTGMAGGVAGTLQQQASGSDVERAQQENAGRDRIDQSNKRAESASGVGETEKEQEAGDRDADGRRLWEKNGNGPESKDDSDSIASSKDPTGMRGANLDLSG